MEDSDDEQAPPQQGGRRRERVLYIDANTGEELYREEVYEEAEELENDELEGAEGRGAEDEGDEEQEEEELDPTPVEQPWATLGVHEDSVFTAKLRLAADGKILLASGGGDDAGFLLDVGAGENPPEGGEFFKFEGHTDSVAAVSFSADGKYLATAGLDAIIKIWNTADGSLLHTLEGPSESIESIEWHSKGPVLLAAAGDGTAWMFDCSPKAGVSLNVFGGHAGAVNSAKFTPDGAKVVTIGDDGSMRVWGPKTGKTLQVFAAGHGFHEAGISALALHSDNTLALTGGQDNNAVISNLTTGKVKGVLQGHTDSVEVVSWVEGQPWAVSGSLDGKIGVWDLGTGTIRQFIENGTAGITSLQVVSNTIFTSDTLGYVRLWDVRSSNLVQSIRTSTDIVLAFDVLPERHMLVAAGDDTLLKLYKYKH